MISFPYQYRKLSVPIGGDDARELISFWNCIFDGGFSGFMEMLEGGEDDSNVNTVYLAEYEGKPAATCRLTIKRTDNRLGYLGEVATAVDRRGEGLAAELCALALEDFRSAGGRGLFLGTNNPAAGRIYSRLGWRYLPGSSVMLNVTGKETPEEFMVDYFREDHALPVRILPGGPAHRVPIAPLLLTPHEWVVLDANVLFGSIRYIKQCSCEGLYPRYEALGDGGSWFAAERDDGAVVGLATVKRRDGGSCLVEGFVHPRYMEEWTMPLYRHAIRWAEEAGFGTIYTSCPKDDPLKAMFFEGMDFRVTEQYESILIRDTGIDMRQYTVI